MEHTVAEVALNWIFQAIAADRYTQVYKLGLKEEDIVSFQQMTYRQCRKLSHNSERFITIAIDREQFIRAVNEAERTDCDIVEDEFLIAGAPLSLMRLLFGMRPSEFCRRRKYLAINGSNLGRPKNCDEDTELAILRAWSSLGDQPLTKRFISLVENTALPLGVSFPVIRRHEGWEPKESVRNKLPRCD